MAMKERAFWQSSWDDHLAAHVAARAADWFAEDLGHECDWTSVGLIAPDARSELAVVARRAGVVAGLTAAAVVAGVADPELVWRPLVADGDTVIAERVDRIRVGEKWIELPCCGVFHLRDGKIALWKDYFDLATYTRALAG